ncbi:flagellar hook-length control protein FliK [Rhizobium halophytocola]|uniref:Chemotaxis protein MotD n=1 Tax=Rhizobium halophytocola TaxID=735519 RepID=A0ABS4E5C6_9HYPH|nr:flagellar hook-length control protein FliK [Rhizobium halophytocola]MBP1853132.1 chemotaxis protein MotD [Rhizobium halophytocola]
MMDPTVQSRAAFDTASGYGAGRSDRQAATPGFSDALKGADRKSSQTDDTRTDDRQTTRAGDTTDEDNRSRSAADADDGASQDMGDTDNASTAEDTAPQRRVRADQALHIFKDAQQPNKPAGAAGVTTDAKAAKPNDGDADLAETTAEDGKETTRAVVEGAGKQVKGAKDPLDALDGKDKLKGKSADKADKSDDAIDDGSGDTRATAGDAGAAGKTGQASGTATATDALMLLIIGKADDAAAAQAATALKPVATDDAKGAKTKVADADAAGKSGNLASDLSKLLAGDPDVDGDTQAPETAAETKGTEFKAIRLDRLATSPDGQPRDRDGAGASAPGNSTPTVGVLESRRYIAPVSTSNVANLAAAMNGDRDWVNALRSGAIDSATMPDTTGKVMNSLKLQLNPIDLGSVTATLKLTGDTLNVQLTVENSAAYRKLSDDHSEIVKSLRSQGYAVDSVQISISSTDRSGAGSNQMSGQQQGQQQAGQQQAGSQSFAGTPQGSGGGREGGFGASSNGNTQTGLTGDDGMAAALGEGGAGGARGGSGVYL